MENELISIPSGKKMTLFAGSLFEDFRKIITRERHILDLKGEKLELKKELHNRYKNGK